MSTQDRAVLEAVSSSGESTLDRATAKAKETFDQLLHVTLNIAVTGKTGSGKSSFVNALRGLSDDDEGAAPTGVTETTMKAIMYTHPTMPNVNIWDLPGIGSPNFKANKYLKEVNFKFYDFFLILNSERFMQNDIMLAKEIRKQKKDFYFVRSKIDNDISSEQRKRGFKEQKVLDEIRKDCQENLKEMKYSKVFLISSAEFWKFDFEMLKNTLLEELPAHKQSALIQAWPVCSAACLEKKIKLFKGLSWVVSLISAGVAAVPVPGVSVVCDISIVFLFLARCYFAFGLDDRSLKRLSKKVGIPLQEHRARSKLADAIQKKAITAVKLSSAVVTSAVAKDLLSLFPGVGSVVAAGLSFASTQYILREGVNELAATAREITRIAGLGTMQ
ncbi:interferon-inducible GTPase 5-like [Garra rufa]|uniref:interferon-inducible GTPase 5-like n=1 Tax=Garra rufa TaxID=137080 RepID=UPI003CCE83DE